jgi:exosortase/archaeosortase family protein
MASELRKKIRSFFTDRANLFVLNIFLVYAAWKVFSYYVKHTNGYVRIGWDKFVYFLGIIYASAASGLLNLFGQRTFRSGIVVFFERDHANLRIEDHCLAIPATIVFIGSVILFRDNWQSKFWFIPLGIACIFFINLLRIAALCILFEYYSAQFFAINHKVVSVVLSYGLIMALIVWWMRRFDTNESKPQINS